MVKHLIFLWKFAVISNWTLFEMLWGRFICLSVHLSVPPYFWHVQCQIQYTLRNSQGAYLPGRACFITYSLFLSKWGKKFAYNQFCVKEKQSKAKRFPDKLGWRQGIRFFPSFLFIYYFFFFFLHFDRMGNWWVKERW